MELNENEINDTPTCLSPSSEKSVSSIEFAENTEEILANYLYYNNCVIDGVRGYINDKGHKVKVMQIKEETLPSDLQSLSDVQSSTELVSKTSMENLDLGFLDYERCFQLNSNEIEEENIEPKDNDLENIPVETEKESIHLGIEAGDWFRENVITCKTEVNDNQDLDGNRVLDGNQVMDGNQVLDGNQVMEEKPKKIRKPKCNVTSLSKKTETLKSPKPERHVTYDRDEMKAYIKAKRKQQAQKRAEEERLKQEALEIHRLKLKQLKEVSQTIVKKCVRKSKEENNTRMA